MDTSQYMQAFVDESTENMQALNTLCLKLEQSPQDDEIFAAMFRSAHTLKGMSATMGFSKMAALTHRMEDALGYLRNHSAKMNAAVLDILFQALDGLQDNLNELLDLGSEDKVNHDELVGQLASIIEDKIEVSVSSTYNNEALLPLEISPEVFQLLPQCIEAGLAVGLLTLTISPSCAMKAVRAIIIMRELEPLANCLQCFPEAEKMEQGDFGDDVQFLVALPMDNEGKLHQGMQNVSEISSVHFEWLSDDVLQPSILESATTSLLSSIPQPQETDLTEVQASKIASKTRDKVEKLDRTIRVSVERIDALMNMLSELVIDKTRLSELASNIEHSQLRDTSEHISRVSSDLQSAVMALRMVPVESLFQRFPRMIRDLSKTLRKDILLEMEGLDTEFDRTVIDEMGEALVHLIRNAADHGLESTAQRISAGKPAEGTICLRAYASGQSVFIEVEDNGGGIDRNVVLKRAVKNHLVQPSEAEFLSDNQVHLLLFESGFSTSDAVSDISGRGVGLDAVKRKVESLGGSIEIDSVLGKGTLFRVRLPLTLAIMQALLLEISGDIYAVPLANVEEAFMAEESDFVVVQGQTVLNYRDHLVPLIDAGTYLASQPSLTIYPKNLLIVKEGTKRLAIGVDDFHGQQEIVNKSLGLYLANVQTFSGATILGDGRIALIFDVHQWMLLGEKRDKL